MATAVSHGMDVEQPTITHPSDTPKRVILRLRVNEFEGEGRDWEQHTDAIAAYLVFAGRSPLEYEGYGQSGRHFAHVEPFQAPELNQKTFHVILDIEAKCFPNVTFDHLPHEIYRVRRDEKGDLQVRTFQNPQEAENVIRKTRTFIGILYPWAGIK